MMAQPIVRFLKALNHGVLLAVLTVAYVTLIGLYALPMRLFARPERAGWKTAPEPEDFHSPY